MLAPGGDGGFPPATRRTVDLGVWLTCMHALMGARRAGLPASRERVLSSPRPLHDTSSCPMLSVTGLTVSGFALPPKYSARLTPFLAGPYFESEANVSVHLWVLERFPVLARWTRVGPGAVKCCTPPASLCRPFWASDFWKAAPQVGGAGLASELIFTVPQILSLASPPLCPEGEWEPCGTLIKDATEFISLFWR